MAYKTGKSLPTEELLELFDPEIKYDEENDIFLYVDFSEKGHCLDVKFDQMFNRPDIIQHNIFKIQYRRYYNNIENVAKDLNMILNKDNDAARMLVKFNMDMALRDKKEYPIEKFYEDVINFIEEIKSDIIDYVEENYELDLNENKNKINTDLQVTDEMNKVYIESSICMRILLPVICAYTQENTIENIFYKIFRLVAKTFGENDEVDPLTKLSRIIKSRIYQTKYSDKKIWKFLTNQSKDMELIGFDFYVSIIESIIPKILEDTSSIRYIDVVLKKKLNYAFTFKYGIEYKPLRNLENDDDSDERDRLNEMIFVSRKDEAQLILNKLTIKTYLDNFMEEYDVTENDIELFKKENLHDKNINSIQNYFLLLSYGDKFEMDVTTEQDRVKLLYKLIVDMDEMGFTEIPKMLNAVIKNENIIPPKTRMSSKLKQQSKYLKTLNKYGDVIDIVEKDNFIHKIYDFKNINYIDEFNNDITFNNFKYEREIFDFILAL